MTEYYTREERQKAFWQLVKQVLDKDQQEKLVNALGEISKSAYKLLETPDRETGAEVFEVVMNAKKDIDDMMQIVSDHYGMEITMPLSVAH